MESKTSDSKRAPFFHPKSRRFRLILLLASGFCCTTFMRMHLAITMTCMVNSTAISIMEDEIYHPEHFNITEKQHNSDESNSTDWDTRCEKRAPDGHTIVVDYGGTIIWSHREQNFIFSGTFWGALLVIGPSMLVYHHCSPRLLLVGAMGAYIISTIVTPTLALHAGATAVFAARVFMGFGEGFVLPSINSIIANWFPVGEKSTAIALYTAGNQFAGATGNPLAAAFCASSYGWPAVFYFSATIGSLWCILWIFASADHPRSCTQMTAKERTYLTENVAHHSTRSTKARCVIYVRMFTSRPFLAQLMCYFITNITITLFHFYIPSFSKDVLYLGVIANGAFASLPNVVHFFCKITWSMLMDRLKVKKVITPTFAVRLSQTVASFGSALTFAMVVMFVDCTTPVFSTSVILRYVWVNGWIHKWILHFTIVIGTPLYQYHVSSVIICWYARTPVYTFPSWLYQENGHSH
ncbi:hypothetical protein KIN20_024959 [Parelaphostrongylus tenuis]|uniref:Major facilitator superfamily (MFS) profile domain-containing protein n=1 Tax=Parelaphostrongylus tenuis TaxID=148309 RepID=A0AAD5N856_PARTN|nr:hypothetical protein KIN20_024959 [Parelaphostrongylus tenuis]